jgi:hypothetical protein
MLFVPFAHDVGFDTAVELLLSFRRKNNTGVAACLITPSNFQKTSCGEPQSVLIRQKATM